MTDETAELATEGVMGAARPGRRQRGDIDFGWPMLRQLADLGIGRAMVVRERDIIAVEAAEGTDAMIDRAGSLCRRKGWVVLKTSAGTPGAADPPAAVTVETIERLAAAGGKCLGLGVGRVRLADKRSVLRAADRLKIAVVGVAERT